jgi:amidohydrolase
VSIETVKTAVVTKREADELVRLRRDFHRHPELGFQERRTSGIVAARMKELGYEVREGVAETGVLAAKSGEEKRTLLVRADMDALPIHEANNVEYKSRNEGIMHACGHDGHTAILMMLAERFASVPPRGRVRLAFQPAEEGGSGADQMIEEGALEGVDAALGLHLWNSLPVGKVAVTEGPAMAAVDNFTILLKGRGGHAAMPHEASDPIVAAAALVSEIQTIASRRVSPFDSAVVSVTSVHGGDAFNVIPESVELRGTVRSFRAEVREAVHRHLREIVGIRGTLEVSGVTAPLVNDARMCRVVRQAACEILGEENVLEGNRTMGGEDFSSFLARVPGCFFFVGSQAPEGAFPHHSPRFDVDERALSIGLDILTLASRMYLERGFA